MQAAVSVFAEKGYHAATVRDVVQEADVAVGTFYFYFPDKETLFVHLYEETAEFLLPALQQAVESRATLPQQFGAAAKTYVNVALYEPAIVQLLLVGGVGAVPSLNARRVAFRERLINMWQRPLDQALDKGLVVPQNTRLTAEGLAGAMDEMILNLLAQPNPELYVQGMAEEMTQFSLRAAGYLGPDGRSPSETQ
jgi:AcrR family transcriptional regulator